MLCFQTEVWVDERISRASMNALYYVKVNDHTFCLSADIVHVVRLRCWPKVIAKQFTSRQRRWPDEATVRDFVGDGCFLVAKNSSADNVKKTWRLTFFNVEIKLFKTITNQQKLVYFLAKSVYYKHIIPLNDDENHTGTDPAGTPISSYFLKTVMMHMLESNPPDDAVWNRDHLNEAASILLENLMLSFRSRRLNNYFLPNVNILKHISPRRLQLAHHILQGVMIVPVIHLTFELDTVLHRSERLSVIFDSIAKIMNIFNVASKPFNWHVIECIIKLIPKFTHQK